MWWSEELCSTLIHGGHVTSRGARIQLEQAGSHGGLEGTHRRDRRRIAYRGGL
jgi:hypothetical protein